MKDCVIVGYHETDMSGEDLQAALAYAQGELPAPIRSMLRMKVTFGGSHYSYLDGFSLAREGAGHTGGYTVSELPSLGTLYLVNYLQERGLRAEFVNSFTYERDELAKLLADGPASVAITTTFYMMPAPVIEIVRFIRQHNATVPIIVGGPLVDNQCRAGRTDKLDRFFDRVGANYYVWESQGEATLGTLVEAITRGGDPQAVPNVFLRCATGGWRLTRRRPENNDLNACAVRWHRFDRSVLGPTLSTRTARSCAFSCAFCDYPERAGALTLAELDTVERELEELAALGVTRVAFIDDTFNVPMRRFKDLCRMMARRDFGIEWFSYFRCGHARGPEVYDLMYDSGCRGVLLGIESGDDRVLLNMDKRATTDHYRYGIEQLKARGIFTHASFVIGFPGESPQTIRNTIDFINSNGPDTFTVNHWYYLHATPVHARAAEFGLTGDGHAWSHDTMTSRQALDAADEIFHSVVNAAWMPVNGLDFWGVPYLLGKGMSATDIVTFLRLAKPLTTANVIDSSREAAAEAEHRYRAFVGGLRLAPARYTTAGRQDR